VAVAEKPKGKEKDERRERLLRLLTYEVVDGKPIYYRGYKEVLEGKKQPEEVMGSSTLQARLITSIIKVLLPLEEKGYVISTGEHGIRTAGGYRAIDVGVFRKEDIGWEDEYATVGPVLAVEVEVKADVEGSGFLEYVIRKVEDLFSVGTDKVVWIFTKPKKVFVFEKGKRPTIYDWDEEVELLEGVKVRLSDLLKQP